MYKQTKHFNKVQEYCHSVLATRTQYALEARLSEQKKDKLNEMLYISLSPAQVMPHYIGLVSTFAKTNGHVDRDTFVLSHGVRNKQRNVQRSFG